MDFLHGKTEDIVTFAGRTPNPVATKITGNMDTAACRGQMTGCRVFMERDLACYDEMAKFLTDVGQGMDAYQQIALACAADYERGDSESARGVAERVNAAADPALDDMHEDYEKERPPAPWVPPAPVPNQD